MGFSLSPNGIYEDEDFYWFAESQFNGFYRVDKKTKQPEFLFHFPEEELDQPRLYGKPEKVGDWLVFSPISAKNIFLYHMVTKEQKLIPFKEVKGEKKVKYLHQSKFSSPFIHGDMVYLFPITYPAILKLDVSTLKLEYLTDWILPLEQVLDKERKPQLNTYFAGRVRKENEVILTCGCSNKVFFFDINTNKGIWKVIESTVEAFHGIQFDETHYWLTPRLGSTLTKWNPDTDEITTISLADSWKDGPPMVIAPYLYQDKLYLMAGWDSHAYVVDLETDAVQQLDLLESVFTKERVYQLIILPNMFSIRFEDHLLHFVSGRDFQWYTVDLDKEELSSFPVEADEVGNYILSNNMKIMNQENQQRSLVNYANYVKLRTTMIEENQAETVGYKILRATT